LKTLVVAFFVTDRNLVSKLKLTLRPHPAKARGLGRTRVGAARHSAPESRRHPHLLPMA
jgi:hypothetical protein